MKRSPPDRLGSDDSIEAAIKNYEMAYRMQSLVPDVLDLSRETEETQKLYGLDSTVPTKRLYGDPVSAGHGG